MRLVKVVQFGLGLAVASGVAVALGGSAAAADAGDGAIIQPTQLLEEAGPASSDATPTISDQKVSSDGSVDVQVKSVSMVTTPSGTGGDSSRPQDPAPQKLDGDVQSTLVAKGSDVDMAAIVNPADAVAAEQKDVSGMTAPSGGGAPKAPEATMPAIIYHSVVLPIQPTITNRPVAHDDLAASVPSAPVAAKTPVPAKSNGALSKLTLVLAGVIVPQPFSGQLPVAVLNGAALGLIILLVVLGRAFVSSYGTWLRRGGFATAARSDIPTLFFSSYFATPLLLGYVPTLQRHRSPLFGVENLSLTLSERRNCI